MRYTELHRPVQKLRALIGNPRSSQQLMGQLPICCCLKAKKFNDFSRVRVGVCVSGKGGVTSECARSHGRDPKERDRCLTLASALVALSWGDSLHCFASLTSQLRVSRVKFSNLLFNNSKR